MDFYTFFGIIILFYTMIYFVDYFMKSCMNMPYLYMLDNFGLSIQPFYFNIFSTVFNRPITKLALRFKKWFHIYFSLGAICIVILLLPSIGLLLNNLVAGLTRDRSSKSSTALLQPVVPGVNLPTDELPFYFIALLIASLFHELGHAIAAAGEDVHINGVGFLVFFVFPGAYVDLAKDSLMRLPSFRQLKILCAGVWHNVVLMFAAYGLAILLPFLLQPFYRTDDGILVLKIDQNSPALGASGLVPGDVIKSVNECPVSSRDQWLNCLVDVVRSPQTGYCVSQQFITDNDATIHHPYVDDDNSVQCCDKLDDASNLCFEPKKDSDNDDGEVAMQPYSCLPVRTLLDISERTCQTNSMCSKDTFCLTPTLKNLTRLLSVSRVSTQGQKKPDFLYVGFIGDLYFSLKVSNYIPKYYFSSNWFPYNSELFLDYVVKFSGALGLMNLVPCVFLDGFWISKTILEFCFGRHILSDAIQSMHYVVTVFGTVLIGLSIVTAMFTLL